MNPLVVKMYGPTIAVHPGEVRVAGVDDSAAQCGKLGGKVLDGPRRMGGSNFCVIQDPAGAVISLLPD